MIKEFQVEIMKSHHIYKHHTKVVSLVIN